MVSDDSVIVVLAQLIDVIHIAKGGLPEGLHKEATEAALQEGLQSRW